MDLIGVEVDDLPAFIEWWKSRRFISLETLQRYKSLRFLHPHAPNVHENDTVNNTNNHDQKRFISLETLQYYKSPLFLQPQETKNKRDRDVILNSYKKWRKDNECSIEFSLDTWTYDHHDVIKNQFHISIYQTNRLNLTIVAENKMYLHDGWIGNSLENFRQYLRKFKTCVKRVIESNRKNKLNTILNQIAMNVDIGGKFLLPPLLSIITDYVYNWDTASIFVSIKPFRPIHSLARAIDPVHALVNVSGTHFEIKRL